MNVDTPNDLLAGFAEELRRNIRLDMDGARAVEATCWFSSLREASRLLGALHVDDLSGYTAGAAAVVSALSTGDDAWPLPTLMGRTLLNLDALVSLAAEEIQAEGEVGVREFQKVFRERREKAFHTVLVEATVGLTQLVSTLQAWDGALTIATRAPGLSGETFAEELHLEHVALAGLFEELERTSAVEEMRVLLLSAVDAAEEQARSVIEAGGQENFGKRLSRR